jgi:hypothetical protein
MKMSPRAVFLTGSALVWLGVTFPARLAADIIPWPLPGNDQAKQRAESIHCVNNLLHTVRAAQSWANDNQDEYPPSFQSFALDLTQVAPTETVRCPSNHRYPPATNWVSFDWSTVDYLWLPQPDWNDPAAVCCRCLVHLNAAYVDGHIGGERRYRSGWPAILAAPLAHQATPGAEIEFQIVLAPDAGMPVSFQWRRERLSYVTNAVFVGDKTSGDGYWTTNRLAVFTATDLEGQTNETLSLTNVQPAGSDYYSVAVSNSMGVAISTPMELLVSEAVWGRATNGSWSAFHCVNNLRQLWLLQSLWAGDRIGVMPMSLAEMTDAHGFPLFGWPVALFCRADEARSIPADWTGVNFDDTSYEVFPVNAQDSEAMCSRCKVHRFYARVDGRVVFQPHFTAIRPLTNSITELAFTLFNGPTNLLQVSTDLVHWTTLKAYAGISGDHQLLDTNNLPGRFYRLRTE